MLRRWAQVRSLTPPGKTRPISLHVDDLVALSCFASYDWTCDAHEEAGGCVASLVTRSDTSYLVLNKWDLLETLHDLEAATANRPSDLLLGQVRAIPQVLPQSGCSLATQLVKWMPAARWEASDTVFGNEQGRYPRTLGAFCCVQFLASQHHPHSLKTEHGEDALTSILLEYCVHGDVSSWHLDVT